MNQIKAMYHFMSDNFIIFSKILIIRVYIFSGVIALPTFITINLKFNKNKSKTPIKNVESELMCVTLFLTHRTIILLLYGYVEWIRLFQWGRYQNSYQFKNNYKCLQIGFSRCSSSFDKIDYSR